MAATGRSPVLVLIGGACLGAAACSFSAGDPPSRFSCGEGEACPSGTTCIDGYCEVPPEEVDAGPICHQGEFGAADRVESLSTDLDDWAPSLSGDGLEMFLYRPGERTEIWRAVRDQSGLDFRDAGRAFAMPPMTGQDRDPFLASDRTTLVFSSSRGDGMGGHDLWVASRPSPDDSFGDLAQVGELNSPSEERSPWLSDDLERLYFTSNRAGDFDVYLAERSDSTQPFGEPQLVSSLNTFDDERWVRLTRDELEAFVTSNRAGGEGGHDIYGCRRGQPGGAFGVCENRRGLNTAFDDAAAAPSSDGRQLYMNLDTALGGGRDADVWRATRDCGP